MKRNQKLLHCIIFCNSSKKYVQFPSFPDIFEFLVKSKMSAIMAAILDDVKHPQQRDNP